MTTSLPEKVAKRRAAKERILFVVVTLVVLLTNQFLSFCLPPMSLVSTSPESVGERDLPEEPKHTANLTSNAIPTRTPTEREAPVWSAYSRQHYKDVTEYDAVIKWKFVGVKKGYPPKRYATEVLTYGLAGVFPWYGYSLPAIRFDSPFTNATQVDNVRVGGVVDAFLDLHQCRTGRHDANRTAPEDYYDACFPNVTGQGRAKRLCFAKDHKYMNEKTRLRRYPAQGHEHWSCSDVQVLEQLAAFQVLDYVIAHRDRFYADRTNNIFFVSNHEPITFVNIDHDTVIKDFFKKPNESMGYDRWVKMLMLKDHQLPAQLREELKNVVSGSKAEFAEKLNATIDGQLDGVASVLEQVFALECPKRKMFKPTVDMLWGRVRSVARFYNLLHSTIDES